MKLSRLCLSIAILALCLSFSVWSNICPSQDKELVAQFSSNHIRLIVMRHGEAIHNLTHLMTSAKSPGVYLTKKGKKQVRDSAQRLKNEKIDFIYASPVFRTMQTAQMMGRILSIPYQSMEVAEELKEQFFGVFEGRTYQEYVSHFSYPEEVFIAAAPQGESGQSLFDRTQSFLWKLANTYSDVTILLVTHGYNCCQIGMCLSGTYIEGPQQAEYKIYDFQS